MSKLVHDRKMDTEKPKLKNREKYALRLSLNNPKYSWRISWCSALALLLWPSHMYLLCKHR